MNSFESAALTRMRKKVEELTQDRLDALARGGAMRDEPGSTGQAYSHDVGYFQALTDVAGLMQEVEDDLLGRNEKR